MVGSTTRELGHNYEFTLRTLVTNTILTALTEANAVFSMSHVPYIVTNIQ